MRKKNNIVRRLTDEARDSLDSVKDRVDEFRDEAEEIVKNNPLASIAIAAVIGAAVALGVTALSGHERKNRRNFYGEDFK